MPGLPWIPAYVGLGSNLDEPVKQVKAALAALGELPDSILVSCSTLMQSAPLGPPAQPDYINAVAGLLTQLPPLDLLDGLLGIERRRGRDRSAGIRWGPRRIDLDLLVYGNEILATERLIVPHPGIASRNFVLFPLLELAPTLWIPGLGQVRQLAAMVDQQ
ncbi:MAG: 2-amino-4-hydroxy-6-hydroxymethyldihydropteridine diphosphokinase [Gammaproteobacteria bacterium]